MMISGNIRLMRISKNSLTLMMMIMLMRMINELNNENLGLGIFKNQNSKFKNYQKNKFQLNIRKIL